VHRQPVQDRRLDCKSATASRSPPAATSCPPWWLQALPRHGRRLYYYFGIPKNPVNEWLVANHYKQFKAPPDFFTAGGLSAAMAWWTALKKTNGDTSTNKLIKTMEGMSFDTPKGKMTFRKEDHQAMQSMYHFKIKNDPAFAWGVPELVREIKPEEMNVPIRNKR
jgi:branched-chain amino acid transport system substrate-binding protein